MPSDTFHDHGLQVRSISLQSNGMDKSASGRSTFHSIAQSKDPFAPITSETLEERKNHILMKHDSAKNVKNLDESEQFKHELSSSLEQLRPAIKDTVCSRLMLSQIIFLYDVSMLKNTNYILSP